MFKPALEAFSLGHELFCSQNHLVKSATLNMPKSYLNNTFLSLFKPALEAFSLGHELFCSQNHLVKSATLNMQKSGDVEVSQGKGGGVGREESPSSSPSFTLTSTPRDNIICTLSNLPLS